MNDGENLLETIEQLKVEKHNLYKRCQEDEEVMYDAVIKGDMDKLINHVNEAINRI